MLLLILMSTCLTFSQARVTLPECRGVVIRNIMYTKEVLVENLHSPYQLALDRKKNTLFFSESIDNRDKEVFKTSYVILTTMEYGSIPGVPGGFANTVDNDNHIVYIGGRHGIYTYNSQNKIVTEIAAHNQSIWQMFYKNKLYYTTYPEEKAYVLDGTPSIIPALNTTNVMLIAVDKEMNIYFSNSTGLFFLKKNEDDIINIGGISYNANAFGADVDGNLYFSTPAGIYYINNKDTVELLFTFDNMYGFVIESDGNIIYAEENRIVRLKSTKIACTYEPVESNDNETNTAN